jgi:hypothetical protein
LRPLLSAAVRARAASACLAMHCSVLCCAALLRGAAAAAAAAAETEAEVAAVAVVAEAGAEVAVVMQGATARALTHLFAPAAAEARWWTGP